MGNLPCARTALPSVKVASAIRAGTLQPATMQAACMMAPSAPCAIAQLLATADIALDFVQRVLAAPIKNASSRDALEVTVRILGA
jgi:hypothetical protein